MTTYNIDRNTASRLLNVSVRTVDRYIASDKLTSVKSDGRVWLSKDEILDLLRGRQGKRSTQRQDSRRQGVEADIIVDNSGNMASRQTVYNDTQPQEPLRQASYQQQTTRQQHEIDLDQLYEQLKEEMAIKDKRLAQASYKIGQLEAKIASMVPLIEFEQQQKLIAVRIEDYEEKIAEKDQIIDEWEVEYQQMVDTKEEEKVQLNQIRIEELEQKDGLIKRLDEELHMEKVNKWIYAIILYLMVLGFIALWIVLKWI